MKAVRFHDYGGPEVVEVEDVPKPEAREGSVVVRVHAASVNPVDWKLRAGEMRFFQDVPKPFTMGIDFSGVIDSVSDGVIGWREGDEVFGKTGLVQSGTFAEYAVVQTEDLARKPEDLPFEIAAAVPLVALTAFQAIHEFGEFEPGDRVLIHAGTGGVGSFAVQFAKLHGLWVAATASTRNQSLLKDLGADLPIDYQTSRFEEVVSGLDGVIEGMGGEIRDRSWQTLKPDGVLVAMIGPPPSDPRGKLMWGHSNRPELEEIGAMIAAGTVRVLIDEVFPLEHAREALTLSETNRVRGKIVIKIA